MLSYLEESIRKPYEKKVWKGFDTYKGESILSFMRIMLDYTWSPIVWKEGRRSEANFVCAYYAGLDFENPEVSIEDIKKAFCDSWNLLGTTRNHQKVKGEEPAMDRFRLLLKFERKITEVREYKATIKSLVERYGADPKCIDGARIFFPCNEIVSVQCGADLYCETIVAPKNSIEDEISKREEFQAKVDHKVSYGLLSTYASQALMTFIPQGERSVKCFYLGKELCRAGIAYDDAVRRILASPTYAGTNIDPATLKKLKEQVHYGYEKAYKEGMNKGT